VALRCNVIITAAQKNVGSTTTFTVYRSALQSRL
jgi:hypothetical protein